MLMLTDALSAAILRIANSLPEHFWLNAPSAVRALIMIVLVGAICGSVGSLVVGNRMAFFSDALAHCSFAGVSLGVLIALATTSFRNPAMLEWLLLLIMVVFGVLVGVAIAFVRERTTLGSDAVIGVFFAGA